MLGKFNLKNLNKTELRSIIKSFIEWALVSILPKYKEKRAKKLALRFSEVATKYIIKYVSKGERVLDTVILSKFEEEEEEDIFNNVSLMVETIMTAFANDNDEIDLNKNFSDKFVIIPEIALTLSLYLVKVGMINSLGRKYKKSIEHIEKFIIDVYTNCLRISGKQPTKKKRIVKQASIITNYDEEDEWNGDI